MSKKKCCGISTPIGLSTAQSVKDLNFLPVYPKQSDFQSSPEYLLPVREELMRKIEPTGGCLQSNAETVLIFRTGQLGDTLVALPAMYAIRKQHQRASLVLLTDRHQEGKGYVSSWEILEPLGLFDQVIFYEPRAPRKRRFLAFFHLARRLRILKPYYLYSLMPVRNRFQEIRDRYFFRQVIGITKYCGGGISYCPPKINNTLPRLEPEWKRLLKIITQNETQKDQLFRLKIPPEAIQQVSHILQQTDLGNPCIAIGPGSKMPAKKWPFKNFVMLGNRLRRQYPSCSLCILGGKDDVKIGETLQCQWGSRTYNFAGKLSIYQSAAILQTCKIYIGNDTGTMHLAAMVGCPSIAIFSARDYPGRWEPYGNDNVVLRHEVPCSGCMKETCPIDNRCITSITVDEVMMSIPKLIKSAKFE